MKVLSVPGSYPGTIVLSSNYTGDGVTTTKVVVRDTTDLATDLGAYYTLTDDDFHNVEVPGLGQTVVYTVPENEF